MPDRDTIKNVISEAEPKTIGDYFLLDKKIKEIKKNQEIESESLFKIAILFSFTAKGIKEAINVECCKLGVIPEFFAGDYKQYAQDILNKNSELYRFKPNVVFFFIDIKSLFGENFFSPYQISNEERKRFVEEKLEEVKKLLQTLSKRTSAKIVFHNFEVPCHSPLGILESKEKFGFIESIEYLNSELRKFIKLNSPIFLFDYNSFSSRIGKDKILDHKMYYLADMKIGMEYLATLAKEYLSYIKPLLSLSKKCLVLDLDNTLWGGIIGEDGIEGIKLGPTSEGMPFWEFQKYILELFNRGVILAINSSNNPDDVLKALREHPYMILKEDHFASMQINWNDKVSNIKKIAEEIGIDVSSMVFIDDSQVNRQIIKEALPEVTVVDMPEDSSLYLKTIMEIDDFNTFSLTVEDTKRGQMYSAQRERKKFQETSGNIDEYLKNLNTVVTFEKVNNFTIPRIAQLTQKTNQFNMTTKRYLDTEIKNFSENENYFVFSVKVEDKFGDNGITGTSIIEKQGKEWRIDIFLLSCRVIGRAIEKVMLARIIEQAKKEGVKTLIGEFIPTAKNSPAKNFYENCGFKPRVKREIKFLTPGKPLWQDNFQSWDIDLKDVSFDYPEFIKVLKI